MIVENYVSERGEDLIYKYLDSLSESERIDGYHVLECFQNDDLDAIKIEPWKGKVKEVYFYKHNRIFFVIQNSQTVYILHACRKQKNKTERKDVKIVESRAKELFTELKKRGN